MPSEETHLQPLPRSPRWTGDSIAHLSLHRRAPLFARLDALPFLAFYLALAAYVWTYSLTRLVASTLFSTCLLLHLLAFLVQHWSANARAFMSFITIKHADPRQVENGTIYALVTPRQRMGKSQLVQTQIDKKNRIYLTFRKETYEFRREKNTFEKVPARLPLCHYMSAARETNGLSGELLLHTARRFGSNKLEIPLPTFAEVFKESLLAPVLVFEALCIILWLLDHDWSYSLFLLFLVPSCEATIVSDRLRRLRKLRDMRNSFRIVQAFRNKKWAPISSFELLPGDIVSIGRGEDPSHVIPCDMLILSGKALVEEATLTGYDVHFGLSEWKEAVSPAEADSDEVLDIRHTNHVLFGGSKVLDLIPAVVSDATPAAEAPDSGCVCYVLRTGFDTSQGKWMTTKMYGLREWYATESVSPLTLFVGLLLMFAIPVSGYLWYLRDTEDAEAHDLYVTSKGIMCFLFFLVYVVISVSQDDGEHGGQLHRPTI